MDYTSESYQAGTFLETFNGDYSVLERLSPKLLPYIVYGILLPPENMRKYVSILDYLISRSVKLDMGLFLQDICHDVNYELEDCPGNSEKDIIAINYLFNLIDINTATINNRDGKVGERLDIGLVKWRYFKVFELLTDRPEYIPNIQTYQMFQNAVRSLDMTREKLLARLNIGNKRSADDESCGRKRSRYDLD